MKYLLNALSLNMVKTFPVTIHAEDISLDEARNELNSEYTNAIGHADTAAVYACELGVPIEANRMTIELIEGDVIIVGQYRGPRLPEGCKTLPDESTIQWVRVTV